MKNNIRALTVISLNGNTQKQIEEDREYLEEILGKEQTRKIERDVKRVKNMMEYNYIYIFANDKGQAIVKVTY